MPQFRYRANAPDGAALEDVMDAPSAHEVVQRLQERGYAVTLVEPLQAEFARAGRGKQLPWTDLELFAQQLHSITSRNLPLAPGLQALAQGMPNGALRGVVDQVRIDLERGTSAEEALRNRGSALPPLFARVVRAGEAANGGLPEVLRILVQHSARMVALQNTLRSALAYPILVLSLLLGVMFYLLYKVLPLYADLFIPGAEEGYLVDPAPLWTSFGPGLTLGSLVLLAMMVFYTSGSLPQTDRGGAVGLLFKFFTYPFILIGFGVGLILLFAFNFIPNFSIFRGGTPGAKSNYLLEVLSWSPGLLFSVLALLGFLALYATAILLRTYASSLRADRIKLSVPRFGRVYYLITVARFSRTLAALLAARVPVVEALDVAAAASGSPTLQQAISESSNRVALGDTLAASLESSHYFEATYCWLLGSAEQRNATEEALGHLAEACERDAFAQDSLNTQLIGPLALVAVGLVFFALSSQFMVGNSSVLSGI